MRILYACHQFFPEYYTGTERYTLDLARQMQRMGHQAMVLTYAYRSADGMRHSTTDDILVKTYEYEGIPVIAWRHRAEQELHYRIKDEALKSSFRRFMQEHPFEVVHCTHPMRVAPIMEVAKENSLPLILHLTDYWLLCPRATLLRPDKVLCEGPAQGKRCAEHCYRDPWPQPILDRFQVALQHLGLADVVISPTQFLIDMFKRNGVDTSRFARRPYGFDYGTVKVRRSSREPGAPITFAFVSTLLPHKGAHILIDAFRKVPAQHIRLKIFGGSFYELDYYRGLVQKAQSDPRIEFCGEYEFENLATVFEQIDVVVVASVWYENAPLVISMAHAFGVPVIAAALGGMTEMVGTAKDPATFRPGDSDDLAAKIRQIADNPAVLAELNQGIQPPPRIEVDALWLETVYRRAIVGLSFDKRPK